MNIDFHSHILPEMDDGAKSVEQSLKLLEMQKADGVDGIVLTPHFYSHAESLQSFLIRRDKAYEKLLAAVDGKDLPKLFLGAEVYFSEALSGEKPEDIARLFIGDGRYLLLELPYQQLTPVFIRSYAELVGALDAEIILAHLERYFRFAPTSAISEILSCRNVKVQINCDSLIDGMFSAERRASFELIKSGCADLLGTDTHNVENRPPHFAAAKKVLCRKCGDTFDKMMKNAEEILSVEI